MDERKSEAVTLTLTLDSQSDTGALLRAWADRIKYYQSQGYTFVSNDVDIATLLSRPIGQESVDINVVMERYAAVPVSTPTIPEPPKTVSGPVVQPIVVKPSVGQTGSFAFGDPPGTIGTASVTTTATQLVPTTLVVSGDYGANLRDTPTLTGSVVLTRLDKGTNATVTDMTTDSENFIWYRVQLDALTGWVRQDNVRTNLQPAPAVVSTGKYALPVPPRNMTTPYDPNGSSIGYVHTGWDYADKVGTPILASGIGTVAKIAYCTECGPSGISSVDKGYPRGDSRILNNEAWNYEYGHYVIVRYDWTNLPEATKSWLTGRGWANANAFVMYAHLSQIKVQFNGQVGPGAVIGLMGNSGNSTGSHLHLEVRYSSDTTSNWSKFISRVADPITLFDQ